MIVWFDKSAIQQAEDATTIDAGLAAIEAIIATLLAAMAKAAVTSNMQEYGLDDGQTKIKVIYKDLEAMQASFFALQRMKQYYVNARNGRVFRGMDSKNFPNWRLNY